MKKRITGAQGVKPIRGIIGILIMLAFCESALGIDFGKRAMTFPVKEEGFIAMIMRKLKEIDLDEENRKVKELARSRIENPVPVEGIEPATRGREFYWDPTYTLTEDAVLPCGKVLYSAGTKVNPLDHMNLGRRMYFIDARKSEQVEWLKEELAAGVGGNSNGKQERGIKNRDTKADEIAAEESTENRIILVGGSPMSLEEELGQKVYFDQSGELTGRMGIKGSPAVAWQEGKLIKINEVALGY